MLIHGDCLHELQRLDDNSVDLIATDPPYFRVKSEDWDRQWKKADEFLDWLGQIAEQWHRVLKPNGSLYCFASPQMAARVEVKIAERFNVLNNIRWQKPRFSTKAEMFEKSSCRKFLTPSETVIFAEHYGSDNIAKGEAGYAAKCDELRGFVFEPLRSYLAGEWARAGLTAKDANKATSSQMCGHYLTRTQWTLPTREKYEQLRAYANKDGGEYLRREYEDLRREYEDLRRPFAVTSDVPYTDVWTFKTVQAYRGKHPCEKPVAMMEHIISASSRPGAVVLDCFMGSGSTGEAAKKLGREFIGIEKDEGWFNVARQRLSAPQQAIAV